MEQKNENCINSSSSFSSFTFPTLLLDLNEINVLPNHFEELIHSINELNIPFLFDSLSNAPSSVFNPNLLHWESLTTLNSTLRPKLSFIALPQPNINDSEKVPCPVNKLQTFTYFDVPPLDVTKVLPSDASFPSSKFQFSSLEKKLTFSNAQEKINLLNEFESLLTCNLNHLHPIYFHTPAIHSSSQPFTQIKKQYHTSPLASSLTSSTLPLSSNLTSKVTKVAKKSTVSTATSKSKSKSKKPLLSTVESLPTPLFSSEISFETQSKKFQPSILIKELSFLQNGLKRKQTDS